MKPQDQWEQEQVRLSGRCSFSRITSLPLISGITVTAISLVSYTAMAGVIGAGGLGNLAYVAGFQRGRFDVTLMATIVVLIIVFIIQFIGDIITNRIDKR